MSKPKVLLAVDAFSLAFRAFYSIPPTLTLKSGEPVNAVFGFIKLIFQAIDIVSPDYVVVCFDRKEPTFRHTLYSDYKGHRPPPPPEFVSQIPLFRQILDECGISRMEMSGFEADDIIGTLSLEAEKNNVQSVILTGDKDALQLVSDLTTVMITKKGVSECVNYTPSLLKELTGLTSTQIVDLKSLQGDTSDNIPGVPGVGEKTAKKLLDTYPDLETIYAHLNEITPKGLQEKLANNKDKAFLSHELAKINREVPLEIHLPNVVFSPDWEKILSIFNEYEFRSLVGQYRHHLSGDGPAPGLQKPDGVYRLVRTPEELKTILPSLEHGFAIDLETTALSVHDAQIVGLSLSWSLKEAVYIPCNAYLSAEAVQGELFAMHTDTAYFMPNPFLDVLKPVLENSEIPKYTHNGKYEENVLKNYEVHLKGIRFDSMLAAFLLFSSEKVGLKDLVKRHLNYEMTTYEDMVGQGKGQVNFREVDIETAKDYAAADADFTLRLCHHFEPLIEKHDLANLLFEIEQPLQTILAHMEYEGVSVNRAYLKEIEKEFDEKIAQIKTEIFQQCGKEFNLNSTKMLGEILYDQMNLPVFKKTKTGRSTDSSVLEKLADHHPVAKVILKYRELEKLQSTYVRALPELINSRTGKIHTSFHQTVAVTGRLSSQNPNLQNIPIRTPEGSRIRGAFIPSRPENLILSADYSQIELRIMAHMAQDASMIAAFKQGEDIHKTTASIVFDVPLEDVTKELRYQAKAVNFGIIYGISPFGLSRNLGIGTKEAKAIIDNYFAKFPSIKSFMADSILFAKENGFVRTEFGRIRAIPELKDPNKMRQQFGERLAVNTRVQGTAADIMKLAMIHVFQWMVAQKMKSRMIIQVHDELVFDVVPEEKEALLQNVPRLMENALRYDVPLKVDVELGRSWQEVS